MNYSVPGTLIYASPFVFLLPKFVTVSSTVQLRPLGLQRFDWSLQVSQQVSPGVTVKTQLCGCGGYTDLFPFFSPVSVSVSSPWLPVGSQMFSNPSLYLIVSFSSLFLKTFCLFIFRERGRKGERGRETPMCGCLSCAPHQGPGVQPRHVP